MIPGGFLFPEIGIQNGSTKVIQAGGQTPFAPGIRAKQMMRSIMLNQLTSVVGNYFPIMKFLWWPALPVAIVLSPGNDGWHRDHLAVLLGHLLPDIAVVVRIGWHCRIIDDLGFFNLQLSQDMFLH